MRARASSRSRRSRSRTKGSATSRYEESRAKRGPPVSTAEPRALTAALSSPAFVTRSAGLAMHAANRHVERWAPEREANRIRPLRNLGFVDRLVSPWIESAQRSAGLRMFSQYITAGAAERSGPEAGPLGFMTRGRSAGVADA